MRFIWALTNLIWSITNLTNPAQNATILLSVTGRKKVEIRGFIGGGVFDEGLPLRDSVTQVSRLHRQYEGYADVTMLPLLRALRAGESQKDSNTHCWPDSTYTRALY